MSFWKKTLGRKRSLLEAAFAGDLAQVEALLAAGADVNAKGNTGVTALMMTSEAGQLGVVQAILAGRAWPCPAQSM